MWRHEPLGQDRRNSAKDVAALFARGLPNAVILTHGAAAAVSALISVTPVWAEDAAATLPAERLLAPVRADGATAALLARVFLTSVLAEDGAVTVAALPLPLSMRASLLLPRLHGRGWLGDFFG